MPKYYDEGLDPEELRVQISELLIATAEIADDLIDTSVSEVLQLLLRQLKMDVVFVAEFVDGQRVFRQLEAANDECPIAVGQSHPLEATYCQRIVDGRLPLVIPDVKALPAGTDVPVMSFPIGSYLSTPISLKDGSVYGTLCCFSAGSHESMNNLDLKNLQLAAQYVARRLEHKRA